MRDAIIRANEGFKCKGAIDPISADLKLRELLGDQRAEATETYIDNEIGSENSLRNLVPLRFEELAYNRNAKMVLDSDLEIQPKDGGEAFVFSLTDYKPISDLSNGEKRASLSFGLDDYIPLRSDLF